MTRDEVIALLSQASGKSMEQIVEISTIVKFDDSEMNRRMKKEWEKAPRDTDQAILDYYRQSDTWFVTMWNHGCTSLMALAEDTPEALSPGDWSLPFVARLPKNAKVLDYGGGFWNDTAFLAFLGYEVTQAEIDGPMSRFLELFRKRVILESKLAVLPVTSSTPVKEVYDGITCFEVLEHLLDPRQMAEHLFQHLKSGGPFAVSASFGAPEHAPYHVASNLHLGKPGVWHGIMKEIGFVYEMTCSSNNHTEVWRKP